MKAGIHPNYKPTTIRCACGNVIETGSTKQNITVEICSKCHPFYTGKQKLVDTSGRVDKFNKKLQKHPPRGRRVFLVFRGRRFGARQRDGSRSFAASLSERTAGVQRSSRKYARPREAGGWFSRLLRMEESTSTMIVTK